MTTLDENKQRSAPEAEDAGIPASVGWRSPALLLMLMAAAMQLSFASWSALQYNFAHEILGFTGAEVGIQQSIREIPGFLSFAAVFFLFAMREQTFGMVSLLLLGLGKQEENGGKGQEAWDFANRLLNADFGPGKSKNFVCKIILQRRP